MPTAEVTGSQVDGSDHPQVRVLPAAWRTDAWEAQPVSGSATTATRPTALQTALLTALPTAVTGMRTPLTLALRG
ncbi:hypothetical protein GCM10020001_107650 [Nonomuraea salmonea]